MQVHRGSATALLDWAREGLFDNEVAHLFLSLIHEEKEARVKSVSEKPRSKAPPIALHTVELLRSASSRLHMGPKQTMDVAERLYTEVSSQSPCHSHYMLGKSLYLLQVKLDSKNQRIYPIIQLFSLVIELDQFLLLPRNWGWGYHIL